MSKPKWKDLTSHQKNTRIDLPASAQLGVITELVRDMKSPFSDAEATLTWELKASGEAFVLVVHAQKVVSRC